MLLSAWRSCARQRAPVEEGASALSRRILAPGVHPVRSVRGRRDGGLAL